jgi:hypothetical protein
VSSDAIRTLIREVLAEELQRLSRERGGAPKPPKPQVREEVVSIASDAELAAFVARLLDITRDGNARREIEQGGWVFRLGRGQGTARAGAASAPAERSVRIEKGMVTERQIEALPEQTTVLVAGKAVRFTPLARDRLRQRGIGIERTK